MTDDDEVLAGVGGCGDPINCLIGCAGGCGGACYSSGGVATWFAAGWGVTAADAIAYYVANGENPPPDEDQ
jgi:hypothetical protein